MSLKQQMQTDLKVFFNLEEFAELKNIDGTLRPVVVDNDRLQYRSKVEYDGVLVGDVLFYVGGTEFPRQPMPGDRMRYEGVACTVFDVRPDGGVLEVILRKNTG